MFIRTILFAALFAAVPAHADWKQNVRRHTLMVELVGKSPQIAAVINHTRSGFFDQKLDHSSPGDPRTFKQRFFVNTMLAQSPDAPVLYYICGEAACSPATLAGEALEMARRHHAILVALEHRYYGVSQPFPLLTTENLRFLRTDFALADLARFQEFMTEKFKFKGKWISMGGSYPGSLSAFYRLKFPDHVVGALASSAPVQAKVAFEEYDHSIYETIGPQCTAVIQEVVAQAEAALKIPAQALKFKALFDAQEVQDPVDFLYVMADAVAGEVQYGHKDELCSGLLSASDKVGAYAEMTKRSFARFGIRPADDSFQRLLSTDVRDFMNGIGARQWAYQTCTEYGYFQVAYHNPRESTRSRFIDIGFHYEMCRKLFGITRPLNTRAMNMRYYVQLRNPRTTNILFTNGSDDQWANLSITENRGNDVNPNTTVCMINGAAHCGDLGKGGTPELIQARELFSGMIDRWLR